MTFDESTVSKRKKIIIIIISILAVLFLLFVLIFLFGEIPIQYDDLKSVTYIEKDGNIEFEFYITDKMGLTTGGISRTVIYDYDNGVKYYYWYTALYASRWNIWFHPGKYSQRDFILDKDGHEIHYGNADTTSYTEDTTSYTKEEYMENPALLSQWIFIRHYYLNPDGTVVLVWEHPDAQNIIERTQAELEPPESYVIRARR